MGEELVAGDVVEPGASVPEWVGGRLLLAKDEHGNTRLVAIDPITGALSSIDVEHREVHEGHFFSGSQYVANVQIVSPKKYIINTPDTARRAHIKIQVDGAAKFTAKLSEGATTDSDGTELTMHNADRESTNVAGTKFYHTPTNAVHGAVVLREQTAGSNSPVVRIGGTARNGGEWMLKRNTKYLLEITVAADNTDISVVFDFYEEE